MRYIATLSYCGKELSGWQKQRNASTVQGELERALGILAAAPVETVGAGRTDAGVNAVNYVCHFDLPEPFPMAKPELLHKINAILRKDIVIHDITPENSFASRADAARPIHARFSARERTYRYFIHRAKDPFLENLSWRCVWPLDIDRMNLACACLLGEHDFSCFEKVGGNNKTSICTVRKAVWERWTPSHIAMTGFPDDGNYLVFTISADRFLRNMVRAIVGTMVDVGRGRIEPEDVAEILRRGKRSEAGESVPGFALFLSKVEY